jgi:hypothetical protein
MATRAHDGHLGMSSKLVATAAMFSMLAIVELGEHEGKCLMESTYRNIGYLLLVLSLIFVAGFWVPYLSVFPHFNPSTTVPVHIHALLFFAWVVLLVIQPLAIGHGALNLQRALGRISFVMMPLRYMICISLVLLPAGLARTFGYWFDVGQSLSQTYCLVIIDLCLMGLVWLDRSRQLVARPYIRALAAYFTIDGIWIALGRPI